MKLLLGGLLLVLIGLQACQKPVEGCTHPRAVNFNPEADENKDCQYYQLQLQMQHTTAANDTFTYGYWLSDIDGTFFYITKMPMLLSELHLLRTSTGELFRSPEILSVFDAAGNRKLVEDNFVTLEAGIYTADIAAWVDLGTFDKLQFRLGLDPNIRQGNPARIKQTAHPLSATAATYMYDSLTAGYFTTYVEIVLPNTNDTLRFDFYDNWNIELPYNITVADGQNIPIRLRLNYSDLFAGISFQNDPKALVISKIKQNMMASFSVY